MISETDPAILADLYATLVGEKDPTASRTSATKENDPGARSKLAHKRRTAPLGVRDRNALASVSISKTKVSCRGKSLATETLKTGGDTGNASRDLGGRGSGTDTQGPRRKGRPIGTPTKGSVETLEPDPKAARRISPRKSPSSNGRGDFRLSDDQQKAVDLVLDGKSIFFTGEYPAQRIASDERTRCPSRCGLNAAV